MLSYLEHPLITPNAVERRAYQTAIAETCTKNSTLVVLPTGMGKTVVALIVISRVLEHTLKEGDGKILFLAPTKPLVEQHHSFLRQFLILDEALLCLLTGEVAPAKRADLWKRSTLIVSTPQVIENDLDDGRIDLKEVALIIFDEAHRATGDYAYVAVAKKYAEQRENGLVLGMTASPGGESTRIEEVSSNLGITHVEIRSEHDPDVAPYIQPLKIEWVKIELPDEAKQIVELLNAVLMEKIKDLQSCGFLLRRGGRLARASTKELLETQKQIQAQMRSKGPKIPHSLYFAASTQAGALKVSHAVELIETQGVAALRNYFDKMRTEAQSKEGSKAAKQLVRDDRIVRAMFFASHSELEHPKISKACDVVLNQLAAKPDSRIIVFTQYRDTADLLTRELAAKEGVRPVKFIGQAARGTEKGLTQKEQAEIIQKFKNNEYNVMCATSIGEEGLDIPSTDLVVFYEPVPSEIRSIQRRGRTARKTAGRLVILITKATRDEAYYWSSRSKEQRMRSVLHSLKNTGTKNNGAAKTDFMPFAPAAAPTPAAQAKTKQVRKKKRAGPQTTLFDF